VEELIKRWLPYVKVIEPLSLKEKIEGELREYLDKK
jgi:predicted DNA-binding transcriptional regulator YafY